MTAAALAIAEHLGMPLHHDVEWAFEHSASAVADGRPQTEIDAWRRTYVRAVFALFEATQWMLKQMVLGFVEDEGLDHYDAAELAMLREEQHTLNGRGQAVTRVAKLGLLENFKFTVHSIAKLKMLDPPAALAGDGIQQLQLAIRIRDRLVHPRQPQDIAISDEEMAAVHRAREFWTEVVQEIVGAAAA
jgi:hypothetical protein